MSSSFSCHDPSVKREEDKEEKEEEEICAARFLCRLLLFFVALWSADAWGAEPVTYRDFDAPPHLYRQRTPADRFSRMKADLESGRIALDRTSELAFLKSLLRELEVPMSSQMLVFSTTSLQLRLISPSNPRAIFFSDDIYIGYIPGGRVEVLSLDPELGAIFSIFDIPRDERPLRIERSERCMNCHGSADSAYVPGLVMKSVVPGQRGGSLNAFRIEQTGHGIPFEQRFGGWYVTGRSGIASELGNVLGRYANGVMVKQRLEPGALFDFARYPVATSDVLPQLLLEHQAGFVNRVVEASYRARTALHASGGNLTPEQMRELDEQARIVTRYVLFADEVPIPAGGLAGDAEFRKEFQNARPATTLRELDLHTRLLKRRCSYMIFSPVFEGLLPQMKQRIFHRLGEALNAEKPDAEYAYLPADEKREIRGILKTLLPDW